MTTKELTPEERLQRYIKKGLVRKDAVIEWDDGEPFVRNDYILLSIGIINDCGCMPTAVLYI